VLDLDLEFPVVEGGGRRELLVQRPVSSPTGTSGGRPPGRDRSQRADSQAVALHHLLPDVVEPVGVHGVVGRLGGDGHRAGQVHAGSDQRREDATHPLDDGGLEEASATGSFKMTESSQARPCVERRNATNPMTASRMMLAMATTTWLMKPRCSATSGSEAGASR